MRISFVLDTIINNTWTLQLVIKTNNFKAMRMGRTYFKEYRLATENGCDA